MANIAIEKYQDGLHNDDSVRQNLIWVPTKRQAQLLSVKNIVREICVWGNRGGGKSDFLQWDFLQDVGKGFGSDYKGLVYRRRYKQLLDLRGRFANFIKQLDRKARWNGKDMIWTFSGGEELHFGHFDKLQDLMRSHGFNFAWVGVDELCEFEDNKIYNRMKGLLRSTNPNIFPRIRAATNTFGPGNGWVKFEFSADDNYNPPYYYYLENDDGTKVKAYRWCPRMDYRDNPHMVENDPTYMARLREDNKNDPDLIKSWVDSSWDVTSIGSMFHLIWDKKIHFIEPFTIPATWKGYRSLDWGSAKPWACCFFVVSNGDPVYYRDVDGKITHQRKTRKGDVFMVDELYGMKHKQFDVGTGETARQVAKRIKKRCQALEIRFGIKFRKGPADTNIFNRDGRKSTINQEMIKEGISWKRAVKGKGSRITSLEKFKDMLLCAKRSGMNGPGFYVFNTCYHTERTVPHLGRDEKHPDDVNTKQEDHIYDAIRYFIVTPRTQPMKPMVNFS